jgi:uroporphyrinogen-III synthase
MEPDNTVLLDDGLQALIRGRFDWLVITSENAALALQKRIHALGIKLPAHPGFRVAVVGSRTEEAVEACLGLKADLLPDQFVGEALAEAVTQAGGRKVFLPHSDLAQDTLESDLCLFGFDVTTVDAYRTGGGTGGVDLPQLLEQRQVDALIFTSPSTVQNCLKRIQNEGGNLELLNSLPLAWIGPVTAKAARELELPDGILPDTYTLEGLLDALEAHFASQLMEQGQ